MSCIKTVHAFLEELITRLISYNSVTSTLLLFHDDLFRYLCFYEYYPKTTDNCHSKDSPAYTSSPFVPKEPYPPIVSDCQCYSTSTPYPPTDKYGNSYSSDYYPTATSSCPCYSSTSYYSSQPSYTSSSYPSPKESSPATTTPYPFEPPSKPEDGNKPAPKASSSLRATYDTTYDNKDGSLNSVACSDGPNGLTARFPTFGDIPSSLLSAALSTSCGIPLTAARAGT